MTPSLLTPSQGRLLSFYKVLFKVPVAPEFLWQTSRSVLFPGLSLHCPILMSLVELAPWSHPEGLEKLALSHSCRRVDGWPCVIAGPFHVPLLPSACLWKRKKERGRGESGCQHMRIAHIDGKQVTRPELGVPSLGANTCAPGPQGLPHSPASLKSCPTS